MQTDATFLAKNSQHCWILHIASVCTPFCFPKSYGSCVLPTMPWRSQLCWELLNPFAHHCHHGCNNFQHCRFNKIGGCCARSLRFLLKNPRREGTPHLSFLKNHGVDYKNFNGNFFSHSFQQICICSNLYFRNDS